MVYGTAVVESSISNWVGGLASSIILAGAAQLALVDLIDDNAPWTVAVGTALVINARFLMYSAALMPSFAEYPRRWRVPMAMLITDQTAVTSLLYNETDHDPNRRRFFYLGVGLALWVSWGVGTWIGIALGASVSNGFQLEFAVPLMFLALLVPSIRDQSSLVAAIVGAAVTLVARDVPFNTGLLIGAMFGIAAGMLTSAASAASGAIGESAAGAESTATDGSDQ